MKASVIEAHDFEGSLLVWAKVDGVVLAFNLPPNEDVGEMLQQHFDRFRETKHDWRKQKAPLRPSQHPIDHPYRKACSPRGDLIKDHDVKE